MSLATRCTSCGTVFRVVQDQLKVSEGWVRCGRCNEVFNALEGLFDLERESPEQVTPPSTPSSGPATVDAAAEDAVEFDDDPSLVDKIDAQLLSPRRSAFGGLTGLVPPERRHDDFADARFDTDLPPEGGNDLSIGKLSSEPDKTNVEASTPQFVREAEIEERWRGSKARAGWLAACVVLTMALAIQAGHQFRERIAAEWPASKPFLSTWCDWLSCRIDPLRRIGDVSVESSALTRVPARSDAFRLSVVLRNRAAMPLAIPWLELSLTDARGELLARRALGPREFAVEAPALPVASELPMQLTLTTSSGTVAGYTVEIFYP